MLFNPQKITFLLACFFDWPRIWVIFWIKEFFKNFCLRRYFLAFLFKKQFLRLLLKSSFSTILLFCRQKFFLLNFLFWGLLRFCPCLGFLYYLLEYLIAIEWSPLGALSTFSSIFPLNNRDLWRTLFVKREKTLKREFILGQNLFKSFFLFRRMNLLQYRILTIIQMNVLSFVPNLPGAELEEHKGICRRSQRIHHGLDCRNLGSSLNEWN